MKKLIKLSFFYSMLGMFLGLFYREFVKINEFTGETVLSILHTHVLILGFFFFLIILALEKSFILTKSKKFNRFFITYNVGLLITVASMTVRGIIQVLMVEISKGMNSAISGIAGIGHITMTVAYIFFFVLLLERVKEN